MINYYQPFILPFLQLKKYTVPSLIQQLYYHSFEDALWDLIRNKNIPKSSVFLIPDFYCVDVLNNITGHGFKVVLYKLNKHFQPDLIQFNTLIKEHNPAIIFIFHACGITSNLLIDRQWMNTIPEETIIIEDAVHRLVNPEEITLHKKNHIIIDSLRKVSPLPGSFLYGRKEFINYTVPRKLISRYTLSSTLLFIVFKVSLSIGMLFKIQKTVIFAHTRILQVHDDIIGDSWQSYAGLPVIPFIHAHINFKKIEKVKEKQVELYNKVTFEKQNRSAYHVQIPKDDFKNLHVYPLGWNEKPDTELINTLHSKGIGIWFKFPDSEWSNDKGVLFLPLGFHTTTNDIYSLANAVCQPSLPNKKPIV